MKDYSMLPVTMESSEIEALADELLDMAKADDSLENSAIAEALIQLIERQAYNYAPFGDRIAHRIQDWVGKVWSNDDPALDDALSTIIVNVPTLQGRQLLEKARGSTNQEVRQLADETLANMDRLKDD